MTQAPIDLKVVSDRLALVRQCLEELRSLPITSLEEFLGDRRNAHAADSLLRRGIEALFDTARHLLSRGFALGALEYREVARKAAEKGLVSDADLARRFVQIAGFRNRLTHHYENVTPEELLDVLRRDLGDVAALADALAASASRLSRPPEPSASPAGAP